MIQVDLVRHTIGADEVCGVAAALCTGYKGNPIRALRGAMASGHESVAEHAVFTFRVEGISRVTLAQLTRHRLMSFSVQSQRYCGADVDNVVIPESYAAHAFMRSVDALLMEAAELYNAMVYDGIATEDARYILPQGITTTLMLTANARELRHFFALRCCNRAQWEIRELADMMLTKCKEAAPVLFEDAGAGCVRGKCPEGSRSCGHPKNRCKALVDNAEPVEVDD